MTFVRILDNGHVTYSMFNKRWIACTGMCCVLLWDCTNSVCFMAKMYIEIYLSVAKNAIMCTYSVATVPSFAAIFQ